MKKLPVLLAATLALSACATAPIPAITAPDALMFTTSRDVIVRGIDAGPNGIRPPLLVRRSYPVTCAQDPLMAPPAVRSAQTIREINRILGPVTTRTGESFFKAEEMRAVNSVTVPSLKCSIGWFSEAPVSRDPAVIAAFAAKHGVNLALPVQGL
ncbi:hypothetical protein [Paracoccus aminophilus]|uniref:Lipoprotein n=1 Tax=Paracoccus aminophilus JCM 7686 TaxID=1367847 RepID=S5XWJ3_PARAH|nr:hypothetical protein [Paracoccus aminophilus]AGT09652.1 hypothetical protein JCM7686_2584 [Paracoccus aminophilus JCM 7686]